MAGLLQGCCSPATKIIRMLDTFAVAVAVLTFGTAALTFGTGIRNSRKLDSHGDTLGQIQVHVNGRLDNLSERVEQLVIALVKAGAPVPPDPNGHPPEADERKM